MLTDPESYDQMHTVTNDPGLSNKYGLISRKNLVRPNHGISLQFNLLSQNQHFKTSLQEKWYPDKKLISFTPTQVHFHHGRSHSKSAENGSEHTFDGKHYDLEIHIVSLNNDPAT